MKKLKSFLYFSLSTLLLVVLCFLCVASSDTWSRTVYYFTNAASVIFLLWLVCSLCLWIRKKAPGRLFNGFSLILGTASAAMLLCFAVFCWLIPQHPYSGSFSLTTDLFHQKNVMIIIPHQDDEINIAGGLIEQYTENGSQVSVVFTTNGDRFGEGELRAAETLSVLTALGVPKERIYYLGFGDQWQPQTQNGSTVAHIYNSADPDALWTSCYGATETYGTGLIDCYSEVSYTRNHYLQSLISVITEISPDILFAVDYDSHADHRAASLFFEEAMGQILKQNPDYRPTVYKGFCYGTAWHAPDDYFDGINLLSTKKPGSDVWEISGSGYVWEERVRFPISQTNLNPALSNNSVFSSLSGHASQKAVHAAPRVLNGDKVFWERRTDSLLYNAEFFIGTEKTHLLNDFKLRDYADICASTGINTGVEYIQKNTLRIVLPEPVTADILTLYDNPDLSQNILGGFIRFSDGSEQPFGELRKNGAATEFSFPEKEIHWIEVVVTEAEGEYAGLCEVELYRTVPDHADAYLMAVDPEDNFVYDYILRDTDTVKLNLYSFPRGSRLRQDALELTFTATGSHSSYTWEEDTLVVTCAKNEVCRITVSADSLQTTFTVSNPGAGEALRLFLLRRVERTEMNAELLLRRLTDHIYTLVTG